MLSLHVLASGSKGNAAIVENHESGEGILVDCGICKRDFFNRCEEARFDPLKIKAVLITHDHSDHVGKLGVVVRGLKQIQHEGFVLYALPDVLKGCSAIDEAAESCETRSFKIGENIDLAGMRVTVLPTSHDALASCGFRFDVKDDSLGYITDTGRFMEEALECLLGVRILAIESNHDIEMLKNGGYPYYLKKRIMSDRGHLSNDQAVEVVSALNNDALEHVVAMHLSHENNLPSIVRDALEAAIEESGGGAELHISSQTRLVSVS